MNQPAETPEILLLLSGAVGAGKTSVAAALLNEHGFRKVSTSTHLSRVASSKGLALEREVLQRLGDELDVATDFLWPVTVAINQIKASGPAESQRWLLDAVRKPKQVAHFRAAFIRILHVHITAPENVLRARYDQRQLVPDSRDSHGTYDQLISHSNEIASRGLISIADAVYDSNELTASGIAADIVRKAGGLTYGSGGSD